MNTARSTAEFTLRAYKSENGSVNATWGCGDKFVFLQAGHRGGCLWCSEIRCFNRATGESKRIASTMGLYGDQDAQEATTIAYLASLWEKHLATA